MFFKFSKEKWLILLALISGVSMIFLDSSILPVALPTIQKQLQISDINLQWIVNLYFLFNAGFVILGGKLVDIYGCKKVFNAGLIIFGIGSVVGGAAFNQELLFIARGMQGFAAALLSPVVPVTIFGAFSKDQRGKAIGIIVALSSLFLTAGPALGGFFAQYASWRWIFFINIFITAAGLYLTSKSISSFESKKVKMDYVSLALFVAGLTFITLGIMEGGGIGWTSFTELCYLGAGLILFILFYFHYRTHSDKEPFFDFALFKRINFFIGNIHIFIIQFVMMNAVFWAIFFQDGMHLTPTMAGVWTLISTSPLIFMGPITGYLVDKFGNTLPLKIGFVGLIFAFASLLIFSITTNFGFMIFALVLYGLSISPVLTPNRLITIEAVPAEKRGLGVGITNTIRFVGATVGMALLGSVYTGAQHNRLEVYIEQHFDKITSAQRIELKEIYSGVTISSKEGLDVKGIRNEASIAAFQGIKSISLVSLVLLIIGFSLIFLEKKKITNI